MLGRNAVGISHPRAWLPREEAPESGIPIVGPAFQPVKTTAWKGCPTTRQSRRAGMTNREPPSKSMISSTNFRLATQIYHRSWEIRNWDITKIGTVRGLQSRLAELARNVV